jgi:hypothetical protein
MSVETTGQWRDERLYILKSIEELQQEMRRQAQAEAVLKQEQVGRSREDIQAAHDKIRHLETSAASMRMKNWIMTALLSFIGAGLFEAVRWYVGQHK